MMTGGFNQKGAQRFVNKQKKQKPKKDEKKSASDDEESEKKTILKDDVEKLDDRSENGWESQSPLHDEHELTVSVFSDHNEEVETDKTKPNEEPPSESDNHNGTGEDVEEKCDNDETEETAIDVLSSNAVTEQPQQNNKNGKNSNSNNKKNKKNAKGGKVDSQTTEEVGEVEA